MKEYFGGQSGRGGFYLSRATGEFVALRGKEGVLPGGSEVRYWRIPLPLTAVTVPLLGMLYLVFLPFLGFVAVLGFLGYKAVQGVTALARGAAQLAALSWQPGVAYLTRRGKGEPKASRLRPWKRK